MKKRIIPIFVPHKGCPHDCIFCNQKKITGVSTDVTSEDARNIIEECLETIDKDADVEIAFFGGSFTAIDIDIQKSLLSVAKEYVEKGLVKDIRMSTRPDCIDEDILSMLKEYKTSIIELGVQSLDEKVLLDSIRGHQSEIVYKSSKMIKNSGIKLGLQMMIGLPADTEEKCIFTAKKFVELKPDCVRVYPTLVVKDTGLEKLMEQNKYNPFTLEESVNIVKKVLVLFYVNLEFVILQNKNIKQMLVKSNKKNISKIIGNKKTNVKYMEEKFGVLLKTQESDLDINQLEIVLDGKSLISANMRDIHRKLYDIYDL